MAKQSDWERSGRWTECYILQMTRFYRCLGEDDHMGDGYDVRGNEGKHDMEDLMFGIGTNCLTAAVILWETTDLQWFPVTLAIRCV